MLLKTYSDSTFVTSQALVHSDATLCLPSQASVHSDVTLCVPSPASVHFDATLCVPMTLWRPIKDNWHCVYL